MKVEGTGPQSGYVVWLTGLSGAGKTTLAQRLYEALGREGHREILDGDEVRPFLSTELAFSRRDRDTNVRRIAFVARLLARNGVAVLVSAISPYREARAEARAAIEACGCPFVEVFVTAALQVLIQRDPKGLYRRALAGEIPQFTGISDPYEPPRAADLVIESDVEDVETSLTRVMEVLRSRGLLGKLSVI